jgi:PAS domain S-box-containing protein
MAAPIAALALFKRIFANSLDAVLLTRRDGSILSANPAACRLLGYDEPELVTLNRADFVDVGDERVLTAMAQRDRDGASRSVMVFIRKDRSMFAADVSSSLFKDESGVSCATIFLRDISVQVTHEQPVRETEPQLRLALDAAGIGDWDIDLRTNVSRRSLQHDRMFGYDTAMPQWDHETFLAHVHVDDRARVDAAYLAAKAGAGDYDVEFRVPWPDGSIHWLWLKGCFYADVGGQACRAAGIQVDITRRRETEEALKSLNAGLEARVSQRTAELEIANRELESFSYSVSHDLRGPLNVIAGFSQLIAADCPETMPEAFRGYLRHIDTAAQRMQRLIEDIVRLARIGRAELRRSPTDLSAMAHEIIDGLRHDEPARNVEVSIADGLSADADVSLMRVALENLLGNAWKFSSKRSDARIAFGCDDQQVFSVSDNGVGFAMKDAERIFRGFQRLHGDKEFKGSGIGLSTAQRVIQRHGGRIWAKSEPGAGATFFFRLTPSA